MSRDVFDELISDLQIQAAQLDPWNGDDRERWLSACHQVLGAIADPQRQLEAATNLAILLVLKCGGISSSLALQLLTNLKEERR